LCKIEIFYHMFRSLLLSRSFDYTSQFPTALEELSKLLQDGSLVQKFHIVEGLQAAPSALTLLFTGGNTGKLYGICRPGVYYVC
jgi:NADPH-dependent curcumin reductase CurA